MREVPICETQVVKISWMIYVENALKLIEHYLSSREQTIESLELCSTRVLRAYSDRVPVILAVIYKDKEKLFNLLFHEDILNFAESRSRKIR